MDKIGKYDYLWVYYLKLVEFVKIFYIIKKNHGEIQIDHTIGGET